MYKVSTQSKTIKSFKYVGVLPSVNYAICYVTVLNSECLWMVENFLCNPMLCSGGPKMIVFWTKYHFI